MTEIEKLEAAMSRWGLGEAVRLRVLRLNPDLRAGLFPFGLAGRAHLPTCRAVQHLKQVCTRTEFERRWGPGSYRKLMDRDFVSGGGRRRWVSRRALEDGPQARRISP